MLQGSRVDGCLGPLDAYHLSLGPSLLGSYHLLHMHVVPTTLTPSLCAGSGSCHRAEHGSPRSGARRGRLQRLQRRRQRKKRRRQRRRQRPRRLRRRRRPRLQGKALPAGREPRRGRAVQRIPLQMAPPRGLWRQGPTPLQGRWQEQARAQRWVELLQVEVQRPLLLRPPPLHPRLRRRPWPLAFLPAALRLPLAQRGRPEGPPLPLPGGARLQQRQGQARACLPAAQHPQLPLGQGQGRGLQGQQGQRLQPRHLRLHPPRSPLLQVRLQLQQATPSLHLPPIQRQGQGQGREPHQAQQRPEQLRERRRRRRQARAQGLHPLLPPSRSDRPRSCRGVSGSRACASWSESASASASQVSGHGSLKQGGGMLCKECGVRAVDGVSMTARCRELCSRGPPLS